MYCIAVRIALKCPQVDVVRFLTLQYVSEQNTKLELLVRSCEQDWRRAGAHRRREVLSAVSRSVGNRRMFSAYDGIELKLKYLLLCFEVFE